MERFPYHSSCKIEDDGKNQCVDGRDSRLASLGRQRDQNPRGQQEKENSGEDGNCDAFHCMYIVYKGKYLLREIIDTHAFYVF
jgi:hypothetical protein